MSGRNGSSSSTMEPAFVIISLAVLASCSDGKTRLVHLTAGEQRQLFSQLRYITGRRTRCIGAPIRIVPESQPKWSFIARLFSRRSKTIA